MKLFEYMASGRPIVASRIPSITEVLSEQDATLVSPDDAESLLKGVLVALAKVPTVNQKLAEYSWQNRVRRILLNI
jgi:glycosyltransferase involved in cell wall biosynthesis